MLIKASANLSSYPLELI